MRRPIIFTLAGLTALGAAGIALAHGTVTGGGLKLTPVAAAFTAAPGDGQANRTCVGADGTYQITRGTWAGTAVSASDRLAGALSIRGELAVNQTTGVGYLAGRVRIGDGPGESADAGGELRAVIAGGKVTGFLSGRVRDEGQLFASVSATIGKDGFTDGQIGRGSISPVAIVLDRGPCEAVARQRPPVETRGTVASTTETTITVTRANGETLTCTVGTDLAAAVARVKVGDKVFVACAFVDGGYQLRKLTLPQAEQRPVVSQRGTVSAVSATSLTVKGDAATTTCAIGSDLAAAAGSVKTGDTVAITCAYVDSSYRLVRLAKAPTAASTTSERSVTRADGKVSAISATSITISPEKGDAVTCSVGADLAASLTRVSVDQQVSVTCGLVDGGYRLLTIRSAR